MNELLQKQLHKNLIILDLSINENGFEFVLDIFYVLLKLKIHLQSLVDKVK